MLSAVDVEGANNVFNNDIKASHAEKIANLLLTEAQKDVLRYNFEKYVSEFESQIQNPEIEKYYIQSWKLLLSKKTLFKVGFKLHRAYAKSMVRTLLHKLQSHA